MSPVSRPWPHLHCRLSAAHLNHTKQLPQIVAAEKRARALSEGASL